MSVKRIFLGLFLAFAAFSGIADAETVFVVNMDGAQNVPADYDGDGKIDLAVFRSDGWYIRQSSNNSPFYIRFGFGSDVPANAPERNAARLGER